MNKDLLIDGEKYISAKRAQENLGYSADYIGQLARSGAVSGKMVGRTWYVSKKSLLNYRKDNGADRAPKVGRPASVKNHIYINGDKFISSVGAAKETGYTTDYIGQLARSGAIEGKVMGRTWYISRKSLLSYKKNNSLVVKSAPVRAPAPKPTAKKVFTSTYLVAKPKPLPAVKPIAFIPEKLISLPTLSKVKSEKSYSHIVRNAAVVSISLMIIAGTSYSWLEFASPKTADTISIQIAESMDSLQGFERASGARIASVTKPIRAGSSYMALALGSGVKSFFSGILSGVLPQPLPATPKIASKPADGQGIVVTSETGDHSSAVERIKSIFSDAVTVSGDPDGASGIITPVFTSSTSSDKYTYVLVPIKSK